MTRRRPRLTHSERRVNNSHLGECGCAEESVFNPQVRIRNMSNSESPRRERAKTYHDCVEELRTIIESLEEYCGLGHAQLFLWEMEGRRCSSSSQTIPRRVETHQPGSGRSWAKVSSMASKTEHVSDA